MIWNNNIFLDKKIINMIFPLFITVKSLRIIQKNYNSKLYILSIMNRNEIVTLNFQERKDDFNIIHKGFEGDENEKRERIDEIPTSKELLINRLGYFKQRKQEIEQVNEI